MTPLRLHNDRQAQLIMLALVIALLIGMVAKGQPLPPVAVATKKPVAVLQTPRQATVKASAPMSVIKPPMVYTNIILTWDGYTNVYFVVVGSTNLLKWYDVTNLPISSTNAILPKNKPAEFFKIETRIKK